MDTKDSFNFEKILKEIRDDFKKYPQWQKDYLEKQIK
jgi:hypothetical protein